MFVCINLPEGLCQCNNVLFFESEKERIHWNNDSLGQNGGRGIYYGRIQKMAKEGFFENYKGLDSLCMVSFGFPNEIKPDILNKRTTHVYYVGWSNDFEDDRLTTGVVLWVTFKKSKIVQFSFYVVGG